MRVRNLTLSPLVALAGACGSASLNPFAATGAGEPPAVSFLAPQSTAGSVDAAVEVELAFDRADDDAAWSLYYVSADAAAAQGAAVLSRQPITANPLTVNWTTAALDGGNYYLYADLASGGLVATTTLRGALRVDHGGSGNTPPTVRLSTPNGGETVYTERETTVTWSASDPDGDALTYALDVSRDDGATWSALASGLTTASFAWAPATDEPEGPAYRLRVRAVDARGSSASDSSDGPFTLLRWVTWRNGVEAILRASCTGSDCHATGGAWSDQYVSDVYSDAAGKGAYPKRYRMLTRVEAGSMPPASSGYPPVSTADLELLRRWVTNGAPE